MPASVEVDVVNRLGDRVHDSNRELEREVLRVPVLLARRIDRGAGAAARARSSPCDLTPASTSARNKPGSSESATRECTSSVSAALQTPGRWSFAFSTIASAASRSAVASTYTWQLPEAA